MALHKNYENLLTGESHGDFDVLYFLRNGLHVEINSALDAISGGGGSGTLTSAVLPLSVSGGGELSIDLNAYSNTSQVAALLTAALQNYVQTAAECAKIGNADTVHGQYDIETKSVTLKNGSNLSKTLSISLSGVLDWSGDGVVTVPILQNYPFASLSLADPSNNLKA